MNFEIIEDKTDPEFGIGIAGLAIIDIVHLLSGNCQIKYNRVFHDESSSALLTQSPLPSFLKLRANKSRVSRLLYDTDTVSTSKLRKLIQAVRRRNLKFYETLRNELTCSLIYRAEGLSILSFLHLYRIIEHLSFAAPLIYAAKSTDFNRTGNFLNDIAEGKKTGLGVLGAVIKRFLNDGVQRNYDFKVQFRGIDVNRTKIYYNTFKVIHSGNNKYNWNDIDFFVEIPALNFLDAVVISRNKMFHYYPNQGNINVNDSAALSAVADALVPPVFEWMTEFLAKVITWDLERVG